MQSKGLDYNWFDALEDKKKLLVGGVVVICVVAIIVTARRNAAAMDSFWHLQMGLDWLRNGLSPWQDHYSFTFNGEAVKNPPYLFQALLFGLVDQFGLEPGYQIYKFSCFLSVFGLTLVFLRQLHSSVLVYCLVLPALVSLLQTRTFVRPELISYSFSVLAIMLYYRADRSLSVSAMLPIVGLMWLWNNYHSPIIGYVVFFGFFLDVALKQLHEGVSIRVWLSWLGWGIAIVGVGFVVPGYNHPLLAMISFSPEWIELIGEYSDHHIYLKLIGTYGVIAISLVTFALLVGKRRYGLLLVLGVLVYASTSVSRIITPGGIVMLCLFAWMMSEIKLTELLKNTTAFRRNVIASMALTVLIIGLIQCLLMSRFYMHENKTSVLKFSEDVVDYMLANSISGRIFNPYGQGGYLIYRLSPDSKVYIDGRTDILYPVEHLKRYLDATGSPDILRQEIDQYQIDLAIFPNGFMPFSIVNDAQVLQLDFMGAEFSLFKRNQPNFPVTGKLLTRPMCWSPKLSPELENERTLAKAILPDYSLLLPYMDFVRAYSLADDKVAHLKNVEANLPVKEIILKFAAYQALDLGLNQMSIELLAKTPSWVFADYLASALAYMRNDEWRIAEAFLDRSTRIEWSSMEFNNLVTLYQLLELIGENAGLELFDEAYMNGLAQQVGAGIESNSRGIGDAHLSCPDS